MHIYLAYMTINTFRNCINNVIFIYSVPRDPTLYDSILNRLNFIERVEIFCGHVLVDFFRFAEVCTRENYIFSYISFDSSIICVSKEKKEIQFDNVKERVELFKISSSSNRSICGYLFYVISRSYIPL